MNEASPRSERDHPSGTPDSVVRWLREARDGSPSALGRALEEGRNYLLLAANRVLDDKLKAKLGASDLVQDTYVEAQRGFGQFRGTTEGEFYRWLLGIMANRLANSVRRYRQTQRRDVDRELPLGAVEAALSKIHDEAATPGTRFLLTDEQRRVRQALEQVEEPWRSVLVERTWQGMTFAEIGARRNCTAEAARKLWGRAVGKMREALARID